MGAVRPSGCEAELFNDHIFCELRAYAQVPDDFVNAGWSLDSLRSGGGKGGALMARVGHSYVVKELSNGDHSVLLQIAGSYAQHVRSGETVLCPIYLHFRDIATGRFFFAMRNAIGPGPFGALYDLKGCADDKLIEKAGEPLKAVHKRVWNISMWCGKLTWSKERYAYHEGKREARSVDIAMPAEQRSQCLRAIDRDTAWLAQHRLMDYSLLVAIKELPEVSASGGHGPSALGHRPFLHKAADGCDVAVYVTIIDYLQKWTLGKKVARCIKFTECNKATVPPASYAARFRDHFHGHIMDLPGDVLGASSHAAKRPAAVVAPPAGDCEGEGLPEERLNSRPMPTEATAPAVHGGPGLSI